jgi:hypothetical protein
MTARTPVRKIRLGGPRRGTEPDEAYLRWIRTQSCVVCSLCAVRVARYAAHMEAAHVGERGLGQKCPDRQAIPLCAYHHRIGPHSNHVLGRKFWLHWQLDRFELIAKFNRKYEEEKAS